MYNTDKPLSQRLKFKRLGNSKFHDSIHWNEYFYHLLRAQVTVFVVVDNGVKHTSHTACLCLPFFLINKQEALNVVVEN